MRGVQPGKKDSLCPINGTVNHQKRMPQRCHVDTDLMGAAGFQAEHYKGGRDHGTGAVDFRTEYKVSAGLLPGREPSGEITIFRRFFGSGARGVVIL